MSEDQSNAPDPAVHPVVLCIDDEPNLLTIRQLVLAAAGYEVIATTDGSSGLALFKDHPIDLVILDHFLPDTSGAEVAAEMKRLNPDVPIILMTGLLDPPKGAEHADMFLTKGLPVAEFVASVTRLMRNKEEHRQKGEFRNAS